MLTTTENETATENGKKVKDDKNAMCGKKKKAAGKRSPVKAEGTEYEAQLVDKSGLSDGSPGSSGRRVALEAIILSGARGREQIRVKSDEKKNRGESETGRQRSGSLGRGCKNYENGT